MARKAFKPSLAAICSISGVGLQVWLAPGGKQTTRRAFTAADAKRAAMTPADRKAAAKNLEWMHQHRIVQGPPSGPFVLTEKGEKVVNRACSVWGRRGR